MEVRIGSQGTCLVLRDPRVGPWAEEGFGTFVAELHSAGLDAVQGVTTYGGEATSLDGLFAGLERSWRGWEGTRNWNSWEGELEIEARRDGSHNVLVCRLRCGAPPLWTAWVELYVEPGEETSRLARDLAEFMSATRA